jgi:hypothetical protein
MEPPLKWPLGALARRPRTTVKVAASTLDLAHWYPHQLGCFPPGETIGNAGPRQRPAGCSGTRTTNVVYINPHRCGHCHCAFGAAADHEDAA